MTESRPTFVASLLESIQSNSLLSSDNSIVCFASLIDPQDSFTCDIFSIDKVLLKQEQHRSVTSELFVF
ncbi:hypothetical protein PSTG_11853 [Puccinia striiformis f. sp. tritici PST-78]|uniref:Uncharacterized protein n=2 Tax=Puccinia striiformis TaxID=27350 RepID=A0A0L0V629_9BASI|nr:hypothetical protein PSTG_11853 [Puccinia striiformis f. sp. tritici PST-78]